MMMSLARSTIHGLLRDRPELKGRETPAPLTGSTEDRRVRGYLLGLTEGVLAEFSGLRPTPEEFRGLLEDAFRVLDGEQCCEGASLAMKGFHQCDDDVIIGGLIGRRDAVNALEYVTPAAGLAIIYSGDEAAIAAAIAR